MADTPSPRVSIVVRTKDRPLLLRRALASISAQTFQDWEAVIVNDGGDPATVDALLAELDASVSARFRPLHHERSRGRWPAANAGVTNSTAPLLVLHDDDDTWHPDFLAATVAHLDSAPAENGVAGRIEVIIEAEHDGVMVESDRYLLESHNREILLTDLLDFNRFVPIGFVYRRELHERVGLYDESLPAAGDWAFNLAVVTLGPVRYVSEQPLAYWHQRPHVRGVTGNSVHAATEDHDFANRAFRDQALRAHVQQAGIGMPLYTSATTMVLLRRLDELSDAVSRLEAHARSLQDTNDALRKQSDLILYNLSRTMDTRIRGWVVRQKMRLRRSR